MNLLIKILPHNLPAFIREEILTELFQATAEAFSFRNPCLDGTAEACKCLPPPLEQLSFDDCLRAYALFTREQAERALQSGRDTTVLKTQLFRNAYPLGGKLREWFGVDTLEEVMELGQILYQAIGVEIQDDPAGFTRGELTVKRCYFSQFYSAPVCDLISALDDGVFSGLSGGGRLSFSERMTAGAEQGVPGRCCRAKLLSREEAIK